MSATQKLLAVAVCAAIAVATFPPADYALPLGQQTQTIPAASAANRRIGAIKAINGAALILTPDSGPDVTLTVQDTARIVRIAPGEKDLKNATPITLQDLQVGDRILAGGKPSDDNQSLLASSVVVMKRSDLDAKQQQELQDWQKRGVGGPVTAVDPTAGTVTLSAGGLAGKKTVVIHSTAKTIIRRYAPDSVKFDDAKSSALAEIHPGDQVRARGDRNADGSELTADEIVSGTFRNIAGTVNSADASSSTVNVHDLLSKKSVTVKITQDSQLHQLPAEMAQRFAARLKRTAGAGIPGAPSNPDSSAKANPAPSANAPNGAGGRGANGAGSAPDLQQMLNHLPTVSLADLHKGDAVIILATEGTAGEGTTITLLTGVEPILQAAPNASGASILTPWSLSAPSGDAGGP